MRTKDWSHVDDARAVGQRLRSARERAGLSQRQLAFPGCTAAYISRVESGDRIPSLQLLREIGRRLGVSADWLATGHEPEAELDPLLEADLALRLDDLETAERLYVDAVTSDDRSIRGRAHGGLGRLALRRGQIARAARHLEEARSELEDDVVAHAPIIEALGKTYAIQGELEAAIAVFEDAAARASERDSLAELPFVLLLANALVDAGNFGRAQELLGSVIATVNEMSDPALLARLYWSQSRLHAVRGDQDVAARYARRALATLEFTEDTSYAARAHHLLAYIELERGNAAEALDLLGAALPLVRSTGDRFLEALFRLEEARALLKLGRAEEAHALALEIAGVLTGISRIDAVRAYTLLADVFAETGDRAKAIELYELAADSLTDHPTPLLVNLHARWAELLEAEGRAEEALDVLKRAVGLRSSSPSANELSRRP